MFGTWILFGVTVLIAVYSGITFFSNINNKAKQQKQAKKVSRKIIFMALFF